MFRTHDSTSLKSRAGAGESARRPAVYRQYMTGTEGVCAGSFFKAFADVGRFCTQAFSQS